MGRNSAAPSKGLGRLRRAAEAVRRLFSRGRDAAAAAATRSAAPAQPQQSAAPKAAPQQGRTTRREADIPLDVIDRAYTPSATSSKAGFRSDGSDHQQDQEFARGVADKDWNDEDHFTNKSGDPRIGTKRRTYEPNETRAESRD